MDISMPRGDIKRINFSVKDAAGHSVASITNIFFTVKKTSSSTNVLIQKSLAAGTIILGDDSKYHFQIDPEDTDNLDYGPYIFDIEVIGTGIKQTFIGKFNITEEVTFASDEGA